MTDISRLFTYAVVVVVLLGVVGTGVLLLGYSCLASMSWEIEVGVYSADTVENGTFVFNGVVGFSGTGQPRITDARVVFFGADGNKLRTVPVGDFGVNAQRERNITVNLQERPTRIELRAGRIDSSPDTDWFVGGLEWTGERYTEIILRTDPEPWYC